MVSMHLATLMLTVSGVGQTVLLDFNASWCGPCRSMDPVVEELAASGYPVRRVDVDRERALAAQFHVQNIPCFVLLVDGQEVDRQTGAIGAAQLRGMFERARLRPSSAIERAQSPDLPLRRRAPAGPVVVPVSMEKSAAPSVQLPAVSDRPAPLSQLAEATVRLTVEDPTGSSYGSGTIISARGGEALVLTCGHVFRESQGQGRIVIDIFGPGAPQKVVGRLVHYDMTRDVGLVALRPASTVTVAPVAPKGTQITRGDRIVTVGCNNGGQPTAVESRVSAINKFVGPANVQVAGQPVQGRSGGGLFTLDGHVIGVCNAADPGDNEGLFAALSTIYAELDAAGLSFLYQPADAPPSAVRLATQDHTQAPADARAALVETASPAPMPGPAFEPTAPRQEMPMMPARMPSSDVQPARMPMQPVAWTRNDQPMPGPGDVGAMAPQAAPQNVADGLSTAERAALAELLRKKAAGAEVICIVRSLADPKAQSEVFVLDRASPAFLEQLSSLRGR